jgi:hypothetical protein
MHPPMALLTPSPTHLPTHPTTSTLTHSCKLTLWHMVAIATPASLSSAAMGVPTMLLSPSTDSSSSRSRSCSRPPPSDPPTTLQLPPSLARSLTVTSSLRHTLTLTITNPLPPHSLLQAHSVAHGRHRHPSISQQSSNGCPHNVAVAQHHSGLACHTDPRA